VKPFSLAALRSFLCAFSIAAVATGAVAAEPSPVPEPTSTTVTSPRAPDDSERAAMVKILSSEKGHTAPFLIGPGNPETEALGAALKQIFEDAGWKADVQPVTGMMLKPGLSMLAADEEPPAWVAVVQHALQQSGLDVKFGSGYRPYYDEKKKENPKWVGVPITKDQAFVIVIGPEPTAAP
jgi:nucleotide-binding universal stress UspA family protein